MLFAPISALLNPTGTPVQAGFLSLSELLVQSRSNKARHHSRFIKNSLAGIQVFFFLIQIL